MSLTSVLVLIVFLILNPPVYSAENKPVSESEQMREAILGNPKAAPPARPNPYPNNWEVTKNCEQFKSDQKRYRDCMDSDNPAMLAVPGASLRTKDGKIQLRGPSLPGR